MGIVHFAGLGLSPGAVTAGLSYLKHEYARKYKDIYGEIIEEVVLFTSTEVASGEVKMKPGNAEHNDYMSVNVRSTWAREKPNIVEVVTEFIKREIGDVEIYCCTVDVNDFSACFEAVAKATLFFHPPGDVGKHIWANITGGTNPLNAALFQVAYLSGFITRLYYTFISNIAQYGKYLQPFSSDPNLFDFREIYVLKTVFDDRYQHILEELKAEDSSRWLTSRDLLGRLKSKGVQDFLKMDDKTFLLDFLHVMQGRGIQRKGKEDAIRLDPDVGPAILAILRSDYVQALLGRTTPSKEQIEGWTKDLNLKKL